MPYYHVYIETAIEETEETDFSKEQLLKGIVKPYSRHKQFLCKGVIIDRDEISAIRILETEQPSSEVLKKIRAERGTGAAIDLVDIFASDFELLEKAGKDVTREFLTVKAEKRRKRVLRKKAPTTPSKNVFIVHGRDDKPKFELARMLEKMGFNAIILSEQPDKGRTIIEKLEQETIDAGYAFIILTPDDCGGSMEELAKASKDYQDSGDVRDFERVFKQRARQNVVLELGYFAGKIGRNRVCCLYKGEVELPSDIHGVLFKKFNESVEECYKGILEELKAAGYEIKL